MGWLVVSGMGRRDAGCGMREVQEAGILLQVENGWKDVVVWARTSEMLFSLVRNTGNTKFN